ncbi:helix-turn-helix domain-containing protein [Spirillospora sp. CA-128828]|uniref:helix-turn-helix domain-containing protein n=1 Tax=Spirillospora sp. CA-128828 TaxID=3240033 RepID=UPI003D94CB6A
MPTLVDSSAHHGHDQADEGAETLPAIQDWIEARLHDPSLCPADIAAAHHISVRQLHRVFRPTGTTVARYIRTRRLEHCRRELGDPLLGAQRIGAIANRWGLPDAAAFSRAFRAAYGQTPTAYRSRAARRPPATGRPGKRLAVGPTGVA